MPRRTSNSRTSNSRSSNNRSAQVGTESRPTFRAFDPDGEVRVYMRRLPHWRQPGATYFVTFRQHDSIPASVLAEWLDARERWRRAHGLDSEWIASDPQRFAQAYRAIDRRVRRAFERSQSRMLHEELDRCHGSCILRHGRPRRIVAESLQFFHGERLWLGDYVIMPNHVHLIVQPFSGVELEDVLGSIKRWTARLIGEWRQTQPDEFRPASRSPARKRFWQAESYDRIIRDEEEWGRIRSYIAANPQKAHCKPDEFHHEVRNWQT